MTHRHQLPHPHWQVAVPRPTGKASTADDSPGWRAGPHIPHRKPGSLIQTELKQEEQRQLAAPVLPPKGTTLPGHARGIFWQGCWTLRSTAAVGPGMSPDSAASTCEVP
jgi:hypothetical protein